MVKRARLQLRVSNSMAPICRLAFTGLSIITMSAALPARAQASECAMSFTTKMDKVARVEPDFQSLNDCLGKLQDKIDKLEKSISTLRANLLKPGPAANTVSIPSEVIRCPPGTYLIAITFQDEGGLAHGALWDPQGVCAKLNVDPNAN
jgi:hypothetical protein